MATSSNPRVLDLDSLDRETVEPGYQRDKFVTKVNDMEIAFTDPKELPWDVVVTMDQTPRRFFSTAIEDPEQRRHMLQIEGEKALKLWKLQYLMEQYRNHFGIDAEGNAVGSRR